MCLTAFRLQLSHLLIKSSIKQRTHCCSLVEAVNMFRRNYRLSAIQRHQSTAGTYSEKYRKRVDPTAIDQDGRNAVHMSVLLTVHDPDVDSAASEAALDQAVRAGCNVNATDHWGFRPVHYAAQLAPVNVLHRLLHYNVDLNALTTPGGKRPAERDKFGLWGRDMSPLMLAASHGREDAIRVLLKKGARPTLTNSHRETALHFAAATPICMEECIVALVGQQMGSERALANLLNSQDYNGSTALMFAIKNKSSMASAYAVCTLIRFGANVQLADSQGRTALHWAAQYNQPEVIDILARANANLDVTDNHGDTAYVTAIKSNSPNALQRLIHTGCDRTAIDGFMGTGVSLAAVKNHAEIIEILIKNGDDPDEYGYQGKTPVMLAAYETNLEAVEMLLKLGANPNLPSRTGCNAIVASVLRSATSSEKKRHQILIRLIRAGGNVNAQSSKRRRRNGIVTNYVKTTFRSGNTLHWPLMYAIDTGYVSLVRILLLAGSTVPLDEVREQQASSGQFFDTNEVLEPVVEWTTRPPSLQHVTRVAVRRAIANGKYRREQMRHFDFAVAISLLPVAERLKTFLDFADLHQVEVHRARMLHGADVGMIEMRDTAACGLTPSTFQHSNNKCIWQYSSI